MSNNLSILLTISLSLLFFTACNTTYPSCLMIGKSYKDTRVFVQEIKDGQRGEEIRTYKTKDTILLSMDFPNGPIQSLFLFEKDQCIYQEVNIFCSPCAEKYRQQIMKDNRYHFEPLKSQYFSKKHPEIILNIQNIDSEEGSCSRIMTRVIKGEIKQ